MGAGVFGRRKRVYAETRERWVPRLKMGADVWYVALHDFSRRPSQLYGRNARLVGMRYDLRGDTTIWEFSGGLYVRVQGAPRMQEEPRACEDAVIQEIRLDADVWDVSHFWNGTCMFLQHECEPATCIEPPPLLLQANV